MPPKKASPDNPPATPKAGKKTALLAAGPASAADAPKSVLILTLGTSPAVLTETVWALAHPQEGVAPVIPDTIEILTTEKGQAALEKDVLAPGIWKKLRDQIATGPHAKRLVLKDCILVESADLESGTTRKKTDVRSSEDTSHTADTMLRLIKSHSGSRIIASISGGRKSMSALLYGVMSVAGKSGDRIVHVVSDPRFGEFPPRDFFFPGQGGTIAIKGKNDCVLKTLTCSQMRSELADLPFVPLGDKFADLREAYADFAALVRAVSSQVADGPLLMRVGDTSITIGKITLTYDDLGMDDENGASLFRYLYLSADRAPPRGNDNFAEVVARCLPIKKDRAGGVITGSYVTRKVSDFRTALKHAGLSDAVRKRIVPALRKWKPDAEAFTIDRPS